MKTLFSSTKFFVSYFSVVILACFFHSCFTHPSANSHSSSNYSIPNSPSEKPLHPNYVLYNVTDSLTRLFFSINAADLLYSKNSGDENYSAHIYISYIVHPVEYAKTVADSGHVLLSDVGTPGESKLLTEAIDMDVYQSGKYFLEITFRDLNKATSSYELLFLDHRGHDSRNNFLLTLPNSEIPIFKNYLDSNEEFSIRYYHPEIKKLFVHYYKNRSGPALPPYSYAKTPAAWFPDSTYAISISANTVFKLKKEGWYTFYADSIFTTGFTISRFADGFPKVTIAQQMVFPLRYLTTRDEYNSMDTAKNTKKAVDNFWLNNAGSEDRARTVIRDFYNRVEICNELFTSQIEGWKTDRGMIYLAFGPPQNVYRTAYNETWIYGNSVGPGSLNLVFDHKENIFTDQEFVLNRNEDYKVNWITAVDSWRQGHVYYLR